MKGSVLDIRAYLRDNFPNAKPGFIDVIVSALDTHERKNNDYNGKTRIFADDAKLNEKFYDIKRKYGRLHNIIINGTSSAVNETLKETALDLGNYAFLLVDYLNETYKDEDTLGLLHSGSGKGYSSSLPEHGDWQRHNLADSNKR